MWSEQDSKRPSLQQDRDRAVIRELEGHAGAEDAALNMDKRGYEPSASASTTMTTADPQ
jgi:hypothetical protein